MSADLAGLADLIIKVMAEDPHWDSGSLRRPWYMLNIDNPVVKRLWVRYCRKNHIRDCFPPSDRERLLFELQLLNRAAVKEITEQLPAMDAYNARSA